MAHVFEINDKFASVKFDDGSVLAVQDVSTPTLLTYRSIIRGADGEVIYRDDRPDRTTESEPDHACVLALDLWQYVVIHKKISWGEWWDDDNEPMAAWLLRDYDQIRAASRDLTKLRHPWVGEAELDAVYAALETNRNNSWLDAWALMNRIESDRSSPLILNTSPEPAPPAAATDSGTGMSLGL